MKIPLYVAGKKKRDIEISGDLIRGILFVLVIAFGVAYFVFDISWKQIPGVIIPAVPYVVFIVISVVAVSKRKKQR